MVKKLTPAAIAYDFDGTLSPGNMQEYDFVPAIKMKTPAFWAEVKRLSQEMDADEIAVYMGLMVKKAAAAEVSVREGDIRAYGKKVALFQGVDTWFTRINAYAKSKGVRLQHYIISSGIREMIEATPIAKSFTKIFASSFWYDQNKVAFWPGVVLNYTTKTQFLFRINKGCLDIFDKKGVNKFVPKEERPVPFENIVFVGDGETDIPCFRLVKDQGGHSVAVYSPKRKGARAKANDLLAEGRVNFVLQADYRDNSPLESAIKSVIDKIAADWKVKNLRKPTRSKKKGAVA